MQVQEIVKRVRLAIDEYTLEGTSFAQLTTDEQDLTRIIVDKIPYALQQVIEEAPLDKLDDDMFETLSSAQIASNFALVEIDPHPAGTTYEGDYMGRLKLPDTLLRIVDARLCWTENEQQRSWSHYPIPEPSTSQVYLMQQDQYARGSWDRPVNILTFNGSDKVLEMYCAKTSSDTLQFVYIAKPDMTNVDTEHPTTDVDVPSKLEASLIYQVAGLTMMAYREDIAGTLLAISKRYMDGEPVANAAGTVAQ